MSTILEGGEVLVEMKIAVVSRSDSVGGADKAAFQLHQGYLQSGYSSEFLTGLKTMELWNTRQVGTNYKQLTSKLRNTITRGINIINQDGNPNFHSYNFFPTEIHKIINKKYRFANLHWLGSNFMSLRDISKINIPILWTMHDLWPILGAEHHKNLVPGLSRKNLPYKSTPINNYLYYYKMKMFRQLKMKFIAPTEWIKSEIENSSFGANFPVYKIPNPVNLDVFCPRNRMFSRLELGLPENKYLILVGAFDFSGRNRFLKGHHHYLRVKEELLKFDRDCVFVEIGISDIKKIKTLENSISFPFIRDSNELSKIYQAADMAFIPSLIENLSQVGTEAQSSGLPVVAFDVGGNNEICLPGKSGFIVKPFDTHKVVEKILALKGNQQLRESMGAAARNFAKENWDSSIIVQKYIKTFESFNP